MNQIIDLGYQKGITNKGNFFLIKESDSLIKSEEDLMKLRKNLISAYDSKEISEALTEYLKNSIRDFFNKFEIPSLANKEDCLSIAFDELKKTSNLSYILSSIEK